jgi:hypothetical protein
MAINRGARASSHPTPSHFMATLSTPPKAHSTSHTSTHKHKDRSVVLRSFVPLFLVCLFVRPIVHGSFVRSSDRSFVRPNNLFPAVMLPKFRSFIRSIIRSFIVPIHRSSFVQSPYSSFFQIIFVLPLCCQNSDHSIVHRSFIVPIHRSSFVHSLYSSFFQIIFVLPLCCRNSDRSFVRSFDRSSVRL